MGKTKVAETGGLINSETCISFRNVQMCKINKKDQERRCLHMKKMDSSF